MLSDLDIPPPPCKVELQLLCHARSVERVADDFWELLGVNHCYCSQECLQEHNVLFVLKIWSGTKKPTLDLVERST